MWPRVRDPWSTRCSYQKEKGAKPAYLPKYNAGSEIGERRIETYFRVVVHKR